MQKLADLRNHLLASPLNLDATNLLTFAEEGVVLYHHDPADMGFQLTTTANVIVTNFTGDFNALCFVVLQWLAENETGHTPDSLKFHIDILDQTASDVSFLIPLSEAVTASTDETGTTLTSQPDPDITDATLQTFETETIPDNPPV